MKLHPDLLKLQYGDIYIETPTDTESVKLVIDFLAEMILKRAKEKEDSVDKENGRDNL